MEVYEISNFQTGLDNSGVNYLQPADSYQNILNGYIYRQVLQSRKGVSYFAPRLDDKSRVMGIFEHTLPDSTKELLVFDSNFLYRYNTTNGIFDQIPFGGSMAGYGGFNITNKSYYISGTSYPTAINDPRFVFTGEGIAPNAATSSIFFYDGTDVRDFTDVGDNPDYANPVGGILRKAVYVTWFNERLNFIIPTIDSTVYSQGVLYSGIRTVSGNGDKFNVPGSGLFQADTYQTITGQSILGQVLALNFDRMNFTLEKTRDAFNPYFGRSVPGVLGTNAKFSAVSYDDRVISIGKTGIISSDGRKTLRIDNKIPYFTARQIDQISFNLTYGGFDRINNQFLWAYKQYESDSLTQNKVLAFNYEEETWSVNDQRFSVFGQTDLGLNLAWNQIDETTGNESWARWDTTEEIWEEIGLGEAVQKTLAGDDLGFIYEINKDYDDYYADISAITLGATTLLTVSESSFLAGDEIVLENVDGVLDINGNSINDQIFTIITATDTSIEIDVNTSNYTPYIGGGSISKVISFEASTIPFNPYRAQGYRVFMSHVEFNLETNGGFLLVDAYADNQEIPFKKDCLIRPKTINQSNEYITMTINQEANFITLVMKQKSVTSQVRVTSLRLHCSPGGKTSG